jgi:peptidoglycan/xylan/chitin deacetylase (PgdA/CDA1 family)
VIGERVEAAPGIVRRMVAEGHALANHTWSHPLMTEVSSRRRREEIRRCAEHIEPMGGLRVFRPPQGRQSVASRFDIQRAGHDCVTWSGHIEDWLPQDAATLADRLRAVIAPGAIPVLHDAIWDPMVDGAECREPVLEAVDIVLGELSGRMRFVTLPELRAAGVERRRPWITS